MCKINIPLNAQVEYTDGVCWHAIGRSVSILINPVIDQVTGFVVKEDASPNIEYIVPLDVVAEMTADTIRLNCTKSELEKMELFIKTNFIEEKALTKNFGYLGGNTGKYFYLPYIASATTMQMSVEHQQIPLGELAMRRGTRVEATDGYVGEVDELVVGSENGDMTHLVMREGHLWGKKDVIIPLSALGETRSDTVFLKLDKRQVASLPTFPVHRHWA